MAIYYQVSILWLVVLAATVDTLWASTTEIPRLRRIPLSNVIVASILIVIAVVSLSNPFHGREYEDAYEYIYAGDLLARYPLASNSGLNPVCVLGSSNACQMFADLSHPTGYSVLLSWLVRLFGFWSSWAQLCGLVFLGLSSILTYSLGRNAGIQQTAVAWGLAVSIVCPAFVLYAASGFSETASAFLIVLFFSRLRCFLQDENECVARDVLWNVVALASIVAVAILVRRDNLLLLAGAIVAIIANVLDRRRDGRNYRIPIVVFLTVVIGALAANLASNSRIYDLAIVQVPGAPAFAVRYAQKLVPTFLHYVTSPQIFGIIAPLVALSLVLPTLWRRLPETGLSLLLYLGLSLSFANTYYFVYSGEIPTIHFERYLLQIWPLVALSIASTFDFLIDIVSRWSSPPTRRLKYLATFAVTLVCGFLLIQGCRRRIAGAKDEVQYRFQPLTSVLSSIPPTAWLVSAEPILVALVSGGERNVVAYGLLGSEITDATLEDLVRNREVYTFLPEGSVQQPEDRNRRAGAILATYPDDTLGTVPVGNRIYRLSKLSIN